ncbi:MAG: ABC transporter substrate-binding protein [Oligoflexia bacterium]|nr:ABC transporter substrate-binding protein [Oligoflexia bacterium]
MKMPRSTPLKYLIPLLTVALAISSALSAESADLKIGAMLCLSGECAEWGANSLRGIELAIAETNQNGGVLGRKLKLVVEDSHDDVPSRAVSAFRKLNEDRGIHYLVGPTWTVGAMPMAPLIAASKEIVVISPSVGVKEFNESAPNILNTWPHDDKATIQLAQYAISQGWRRAAIFGSQDPFVKVQSDAFQAEFTKLGGLITTRVEPLPSSRDLKAEALRVRASTPDVIFFSNYQVDVFAKELQRINCQVPRLSILMEKERVKAAQGALENTIFALYAEPTAAFKDAFRLRYRQEPGITADTAYDAVMLFVRALRDVGRDDAPMVAARLHTLKDFRGASGIFSVDSKGAVDKLPVLWAVHGLDYRKLEASR